MESTRLQTNAGRKRIRLERPAYQQPGSVCSITIVVNDRRPIFASLQMAEAAVEILEEHARRRAVAVYAYCVMPDHVHLLLSPSETCDVITFVGEFKSLVQRAAWEQGTAGHVWQRSFWDHLLRADEELEQAVSYVVNNPVRAGLVDAWMHYPFAGSLTWDL